MKLLCLLFCEFVCSTRPALILENIIFIYLNIYLKVALLVNFYFLVVEQKPRNLNYNLSFLSILLLGHYNSENAYKRSIDV